LRGVSVTGQLLVNEGGMFFAEKSGAWLFCEMQECQQAFSKTL